MRNLCSCFSMILLMLMSVLVTSCSQEQVSTFNEVSYLVNVTGTADGNVQFQWADNTFVFDGVTQLNVDFYNDTSVIHNYDSADYSMLIIDDVLESSGDYPPDTVAVANRINEQINAKVDKASGDYDFRVSGHLYDMLTGTVLYIDRRFTSNDTLSISNL